jgi:hypothetical protein
LGGVLMSASPSTIRLCRRKMAKAINKVGFADLHLSQEFRLAGHKWAGSF